VSVFTNPRVKKQTERNITPTNKIFNHSEQTKNCKKNKYVFKVFLSFTPPEICFSIHYGEMKTDRS